MRAKDKRDNVVEAAAKAIDPEAFDLWEADYQAQKASGRKLGVTYEGMGYVARMNKARDQARAALQAAHEATAPRFGLVEDLIARLEARAGEKVELPASALAATLRYLIKGYAPIPDDAPTHEASQSSPDAGPPPA